MKKLFLRLTLVILGSVCTANANLLTNGDFETGNLMGWTTLGNVLVVDFPTPSLPDFLASTQGMDDNFALLGLGTLSGVSSLDQSFSVSGADSITLEFDFAFDYLDLNPFSGDSFLSILTITDDIVGEVTLLDLTSTFGVGANFGTFSQTYILDPSLNFDGNISFQLSELGGPFSGGTASFAGIDNISVTTTSPVPEPSTMLLMGLGLLGTMVLIRRKKS